MNFRFGPDFPKETYVPHSYPEQMVDLGEVAMNYVATGPEQAPALLLIPGQTESWWGYEKVIPLLEKDFRIYAVDLRGQGRSSRTPGRYTLDNMGNDLVRFIQTVIGKATIVAGLSSGGVLSCWLSAYAPPGLIRGAYYEDAPIFSSEVTPACGPSIRQNAYSILFALRSKYLGDQWSVGDWKGMTAAVVLALPEAMVHLAPRGDEPPQNLKEYDPEWARAFLSGTATINCDHGQMLRKVKVPVLFTHHFRKLNPIDGTLMGSVSDLQVDRARRLIEAAGQRFEYHSFPEVGHFLHAENPALYLATLLPWTKSLEPTPS
ncbi:MAG TPA: alpha/beta hydrolase [Chthoniobacterales bacterium]|jgi:pimeloyl-ACP methyl ester carboxylesterase|nr:alpha/beta hydrolase [Chthoniobacterales bacterium]